MLAGARQKTFVLERRINGKPRRVTLGRAVRSPAEGDRGRRAIDRRDERRQRPGGTRARADRRRHDASKGWELTKEALKKKNRSHDVGGLSSQDRLPFVRLLTGRWWRSRAKFATTPHQDRRGSGHILANGAMRVLRADLAAGAASASRAAGAPTMNVDFYAETGRTDVIKDWPAWWKGVQQIANPVRRYFDLWLAYCGCRAGETMTMEVRNIDLENRWRHIRSPRPWRSNCR